MRLNMFNFSYDKRMLYIMLIILILPTILSRMQTQNGLLMLLLTLPGIIIGITFHEFSHALAADKLGDDTPRHQGRLSLNPLDHLDPIGSVMLLIAGFGWGRPVETNPRNYSRKISMEKGEAIVSVAGPLMNFIVAGVLYLISYLITRFTGIALLFTEGGIMYGSGILPILLIVIYFAIKINIILGIFNLIPLPPLDGSKIIKIFLPQKAKIWYINHEQILYIVFIVLWILSAYI